MLPLHATRFAPAMATTPCATSVTSADMNYRDLLKKYMAHVMATEGVSFLETGYINPGWHGITPEDIAALRVLNAEVIRMSYVNEDPP